MQDAFTNIEAVLGHEKSEILARSRIAVFGIGGAGSFATESLARCGVGSLTLVDGGRISGEEISCHLYASADTVGRSKVSLAKEHIHSIDEGILVHTYETGYDEDTADLFDLSGFDYVVDTLEEYHVKTILISRASRMGIRIISCLNLCNLLDASKLGITDISRSGAFPEAKNLREKLKTEGIRNVKVLASRERPNFRESTNSGKETGCICYMNGIAGMMLAAEVVGDLTGLLGPSKKSDRRERIVSRYIGRTAGNPR